MLKVGLTGGIASGKSHVLRRFREAGFETLDLDAVSRDVMAPGGSAHQGVVDAFGPGIVAAGAIDRKALGALVFADPAARRRLEAIVHPRIREAEALHLSSSAPGKVAVVDAALLVESGQHLRFARLVVVYCATEVQLRRLMTRDGLTAAAARARLEAQMPPEEKRRFGHMIVDNSGGLAETDEQVAAIVAALAALASGDSPKPAAIPAERAAAAIAAGPARGPRGLRPWRVVEDIAAGGDLDMARMAALAEPASEGPWHTAALFHPPGEEPPETLALPVAVWAAGRRPGDEAFTIAAAATLARLTHRDPAALSGAVLAALAALRFLSTGDAASLRAGLAAWTAAASGWTGAAPPARTVATVSAAAQHAGDGDAAAREAAAKGGVGDLARALAGGAAEAGIDPERLRQVARLLAPRAA